ncbi:MAG: class F sortase [Hamadaea sp.]|nr:class F sortase [Hamadaea sp.]
MNPLKRLAAPLAKLKAPLRKAGSVALLAGGIAGVVMLAWAVVGPDTPTAVRGFLGQVPGGAIGIERAEPVRLRIPSIGVDAQVTPLGVDEDGEVQVPPLAYSMVTGWYHRGPSPGELGAAVILGHVDAAPAGPAVFYDLGKLKPGAEVAVARDDGRTAVFTVEAVRSFPKDAFPHEKIYGPVQRAEVRLVTCGGPFEGDAYRDNLVVFAVLSEVR